MVHQRPFPRADTLLLLSRFREARPASSLRAIRWSCFHRTVIRGSRLGTDVCSGGPWRWRLRDSTLQAGKVVRCAEKASVSTTSHNSAHLVIGGGLAGAMAGLRLATAGREVTLLERERLAHHKVCGEFLSREAVELLSQVGVNALELGAEEIRFVRLASRRRVVETALPFTALSVSRCVLDEALLARAAQE